MAANDNVDARYQSQIARLDEQLADMRRRDAWFSRARGVVFLICLAFALTGWFSLGPRLILLTLAGIVFVGFVTVIGCHESLRERLYRTSQARLLQARQLARYRRDWSGVPVPHVELPTEFAPLARDLDLFGQASVFQWLCRAHTPRGRTLLRDWLLTLPEPAEIVARQEAVQQLAPLSLLRDELDLRGHLLAASDTGPEAFVAWAEGPLLYQRRYVLRWLVRLLTVATLGLFLALAMQWIPSAGWLVLIGLIAVNILVNAFYVGSIHELFNRITAGGDELGHYEALFAAVDTLPESCERLTHLRHLLNAADVEYLAAFRELKRIMKLANGRRSSLWGIPYVFIQILVFWDFHVLVWLESWQRRCGHHVSDWFDAVAELEALCSLATIAADHDDWVYPRVEPGLEKLTAKQLGHPLLPADCCERNDAQLGPCGTFLLVTGSNMSGKSTLLRAIGVNSVLAQAGAPLRATQWSMPPVELATSMRVTDSLDDGVSFFFAELKRLKAIVDQSQAIESDGGVRLLFLLDEILQGTNSAERHIAVAKVIGHLIEQPAIGAVSTHDLELANEPQLKQCCQTVHFREQFAEVNGKREMSFDYRLRSGVSPTTNALKLLEMVGLGDKRKDEA